MQLLEAQQLAPPRKILLTVPLQEDAGKEVRMWINEIAPGASTPKHFHPGDEFIHVLKGSVVVQIEGRPEVTLTPGLTIHIPAGAVHLGRNPSATVAAKVMTFGVFEKGKPDMTRVP